MKYDRRLRCTTFLSLPLFPKRKSFSFQLKLFQLIFFVSSSWLISWTTFHLVYFFFNFNFKFDSFHFRIHDQGDDILFISKIIFWLFSLYLHIQLIYLWPFTFSYSLAFKYCGTMEFLTHTVGKLQHKNNGKYHQYISVVPIIFFYIFIFFLFNTYLLIQRTILFTPHLHDIRLAVLKSSYWFSKCFLFRIRFGNYKRKKKHVV